MDLIHLLDSVVYGNTVQAWGVAAVVAVVTLIALRVLQAAGTARLGALAAKARLPGGELVVEALRKTKLFALLLAAVYVATLGLTLSDRAHTIITRITVIALLLQGGIWIVAGLNTWL